MDTKKLNAFIKVAETGSFSKAANELNYTQSGITHMMKSIESEVGITLFQRHFNGVSLTQEGEHLLPFIKDAVQKYALLETEINFLNNKQQQSLYIGAYSSVALCWLPEITKRYRQKYPNITLEFSPFTVEGMRSAITNAEINVGFCTQPKKEFKWLPLHKDPLLAILPKEYNLSKPFFDINNFDNTDFLMPAYGFEEDISGIFEKGNVSPKIKHTFVDDSVIISMVSCNLGISILSELVMKAGNFSEVRAVPISPTAYRTLGIATLPKNYEKQYIKDFIKISRDYIKEIYGDTTDE